jgi:catechol 2,3-dioxygenase
MKVAIGPRRLAHVNIFVSDLKSSASFYRDVCGFREVFSEPGISALFLSNGNTHHDLALMETTSTGRAGRGGHVQVASGRGRAAGLNHLGFEMETEAKLVDGIRRAKASGIEIDRTTDHQITHAMYLYDPDGHLVEFYADVADDWREVFQQGEGQLLSGAWDPEASEPLTDTRVNPAPDIRPLDESLLPARATAYAGLPVRDLQASLAFYTDVLGLEVTAGLGGERFAVLAGTADGGCDVCLVETDAFPPTNLLFVGVQMSAGKPTREAFEAVRAQDVPARLVEGDGTEAVVIVDPDGMIFVYSVAPPRDVMERCGAGILEAGQALAASVRMPGFETPR